MIQSMTGYGAGRAESKALAIRVELRSVNGRNLKINMRLPGIFSGLESTIEKELRKNLGRGSVQLNLNLDYLDPAGRVNIDEDLVKAYQSEFQRLGLNQDVIPNLSGVLSQSKGSDKREEVDEKALDDAIQTAIAELVTMRKHEGQALETELQAICTRILDLGEKIGERAPEVAAEYKAKLETRIEELLQNKLEADDALIAREVALFADRSDIREEVARLDAHINQIRHFLSSDEEVGKRLEFLSQELLREANTMGSKSSEVQLSHWVVDLKAEIEKFKEQVANVL